MANISSKPEKAAAIRTAYMNNIKPNGSFSLEDCLFGEIILAAWRKPTDTPPRPTIRELLSKMDELMARNFPKLARKLYVDVIAHFVSSRISDSVTPYAFHYRKSSRLVEHERMIDLDRHSDVS